MGKGRGMGMVGKEKHRKERSRASVQPESLVDRNIADNVFFKPIKQPEDENILRSFF